MTPHYSMPEKDIIRSKEESESKYELEIKWIDTLIIIIVHLCFLYAVYIYLPLIWGKTVLFNIFWGMLSGIGLTAGAHRLWSHRSYKAKLPLRIILGIFHSMAVETNLYAWCRDHRLHHKFCETDADPYNPKRGFFFAHVGWLMCKKHPDIHSKGHTIDVSDLMADPVVQYVEKFHIPIALFFGFYFPTMIPVWLWGESVEAASAACLMRFVIVLNITWSANSFGHLLGNRPFDKNVTASDNILMHILTQGEGWHNFHHVFPWDYSSSELGFDLNLTRSFIDVMAWLGLAYDLKKASKKVIDSRMLRTGDGTRIKKP